MRRTTAQGNGSRCNSNLKRVPREPGTFVSAENAARRHGRFYDLADSELELLCEACIGRTNGYTEAAVTVQTCWDADRLDLGRVGIEPAPVKLSTAPARKPVVINWAYRRRLER